MVPSQLRELRATRGAQGINVTPFCVEQGVGWVWILNGTANPAPQIAINSERPRNLSPALRNFTPGGSVLWADHPVTGQPLVAPGPPFHVVWNFLAVAFGVLWVEDSPVVSYFLNYDGCKWESTGKCCEADGSCVESPYVTELHGALMPGQPAHQLGVEKGGMVCHPWGVVPYHNAIAGKALGAKSPGGGFKCKGAAARAVKKIRSRAYFLSVCSRRVHPVGLWAELGLVRQRMAAQFGIGEYGNGTYRIGLLKRNETRAIVNSDEMVRMARERQWDIEEIVLEQLPLAQQLAMLAGAGVVVGVHGSAHIWVLFGMAGQIYIELSANSQNSPDLSPSSAHIGVDKYMAGMYGSYAAFADAHHIGWKAGNSKRNLLWKQMNVFLPGQVWGTMLNVSRSIITGHPPWRNCDVLVA
eukprot:Hpha_TRINITY_DN30391_c0_g1::TRINITY_DN30391_c0_g1_i1::g.147104::m.147104